MSLYVGGKKYNVTIAKWRGFWSVTIHGFPGTIIDCGSQKVIGDDGKVTFKFAEADTYTFIAMKGDKTEVLEVELVEGEYFVEKNVYIGVTLLEYIEGTGTQWIQTDFFFNNIATDTLTCDFMRTGSGGPSPIGLLYGCREAYLVNGYGFQFEDSGATYRQYGNNASGLSTSFPLSLNTRYELKHTGYSYTIAGKTFSQVASTPIQNYPLTIFAIRNGTALPTSWAKMRLYGFNVVSADGETLLNLVPAQIYVDGNLKTGMFDQVTEQFFYNQGTGDFIAGPIKE